jgi:hypothetical protein
MREVENEKENCSVKYKEGQTETRHRQTMLKKGSEEKKG